VVNLPVDQYAYYGILFSYRIKMLIHMRMCHMGNVLMKSEMQNDHQEDDFTWKLSVFAPDCANKYFILKFSIHVVCRL
jgi:hypothetical protein